jgi:hypothetical protein
MCFKKFCICAWHQLFCLHETCCLFAWYVYEFRSIRFLFVFLTCVVCFAWRMLFCVHGSNTWLWILYQLHVFPYARCQIFSMLDYHRAWSMITMNKTCSFGSCHILFRFHQKCHCSVLNILSLACRQHLLCACMHDTFCSGCLTHATYLRDTPFVLEWVTHTVLR